MTDLELTRRVIMALATSVPSPMPILDQEAEVSALIPSAMQALADEVAKDSHRSPLLTQDYICTIVTGYGPVLPVPGSITATNDILYWSIPYGVVRDSATNVKLTYIPNREQFEGYLMPGLLYYTLTNQRIMTRSAVTGDYFNSDRWDVQGPLEITANFVPTPATLPVTLENDAIDLMVKMILMKIQADKAE